MPFELDLPDLPLYTNSTPAVSIEKGLEFVIGQEIAQSAAECGHMGWVPALCFVMYVEFNI